MYVGQKLESVGSRQSFCNNKRL